MKARVLKNALEFQAQQRDGGLKDSVSGDCSHHEADAPNIVTRLVEVLYKHNEPVPISDDVYSLTIAANLSGNCSPQAFLFSLRQCIFVFIL